MDEEKFREESIALQKERLELDRKRFEVESAFFRKHFGSIVSVLAGFLIFFLGFAQVTISRQIQNEAEIKLATEISMRKIEVYLIYPKVVNQAWAQYATSGTVDGDLRQQGIDAYEEIRLIAGDDLLEHVDELNKYFSELYSPFEISDDDTRAFNNVFNTVKEAMRSELVLE